ncbi:MAG: hypothetical protein COX65_06870 [Elusimicrobia bacterium CG_4_10_14_0_2_um_filter_56_8]|nr:MAG: hypothetical protein AUJ51_08980 [Elusimicrobia bacterium CG1_02_56_21]PJA13565.1 MAG: hypothetical protein COX65_06870 [Elusimicrobia bacterium CG_4_10_14_0_2_um_filter_56_8]
MAETIGSLADKLSILQLKIFHMKEQLQRTDAPQAHTEACTARLGVMAEQRKDLEEELTRLVSDVAAGRVRLKIYRQFKMYNDPKYRAKTAAAANQPHESRRK